MKKDVSTIVSGMGLATSIINGLVVAVKKAGGSDADIHKLATPDNPLLDEIAKLVVNGKQLAQQVVETVSKAIKKITVNYARSLADMIAKGEFDGGVNSDITEKNFPHTGSGLVELEPVMLHYGRNIPSSDVLEDMKARGLRAANMAELVAYGTANPDEQRKYPIVALGQVARVWRDRRVGCLDMDAFRRRFGLYVFEHDWNDCCRFLAFRK